MRHTSGIHTLHPASALLLLSLMLLMVLVLPGCAESPAGRNAASAASPSASESVPATVPATTATPTSAPTPSPTPALQNMTVTVDAEKRYQTFLGFGGNYTQVQYTGKAQDSIGAYTLETLRPAWVRVPIPLDLWEPENENRSAKKLDMTAFRKDDARLVELFTMMKEMKESKGVRNITASVWNVAPWMVGATEGVGGIIPEELYPEVAESMVAFLLHLRDAYGVTVDQVSFNEPDIGTNVRMNTAETIAFVRVIGPMMEKSGLSTKWMIGDVSQPSPTTTYAKELLGQTDLLEYLGPVSYHSWNSSTVSDRMLSTIRDYMATTDRILIAGEFGYNPGLWKTPAEFPTWQNGWFLANLIYRNIKFTGANVILYWELQNDYPLMSETLEPYPAWHVFRQAFDTLKPGCVLLDCQSEDEAFLGSYAAADDKGYFTVQLLNKRDKAMQVTVNGLPDGVLDCLVTKEDAFRTDAGSFAVSGGTLVLEVPPKSMISLYTP